MKLEFSVGDKRLIEPEFEVYSYKNHDNLIIVGIKDFLQEDEIIFTNALKDKNYKINMENKILGLEIYGDVYSFDLSGCLNEFLTAQLQNFFYIGFVFAGDNGILKKSKIKAIKMVAA